MPPAAARFVLLCAGHEVALPPGNLVIGRGSRCHIVIDDHLASREHARLIVTADRVVVEDLNSTNGVYVNERRVTAPTRIFESDRLVIGTQELLLHVPAPSHAPEQGARAPIAEHPELIVPSRKQSGSHMLELDEPGVPSPAPPADSQTDTEKASVIGSLGRLADRMLTMGRIEPAERVMRGHIEEVLMGAREGRQLPDDVLEAATDYALKFAELLHKASWIDYAVELHMLARKPMNGPSITRLAALLPLVEGVDKEVFFFYQQVIRSQKNDASLAVRVLCDRILAMELPP
jgi:hypothetical protein